jgi:hypothetical protein
MTIKLNSVAVAAAWLHLRPQALPFRPLLKLAKPWLHCRSLPRDFHKRGCGRYVDRTLTLAPLEMESTP